MYHYSIAAAAVILLLSSSAFYVDCVSSGRIIGSCSKVSSLTFHSVLSVQGCPLYVHRYSSSKSSAHFLIEPALCIVNTSWLVNATPRHDAITNTSYIAVPLLLQSEQLLVGAWRQLKRSISNEQGGINSTAATAHNYVQFMQLQHATFEILRNSAYSADDFIWSRGEDLAFLRIRCNCLFCFELINHLQHARYHVINNIIATTRSGISQSCRLLPQRRQISVAGQRVPIQNFQRQLAPAAACTNLQFVQAVHTGNCTVNVYKLGGAKASYATLPALCFAGNFSLRREHSDNSCCSVVIQLPLASAAASASAVNRSLRRLAPKSVDAMKLWDASISSGSALKQWRLRPLLLSHDRSHAELKVNCDTWLSCLLLNKILSTDPINFWRHIRWTPSGQLSKRQCIFQPPISLPIFRQQELQDPVTMPPSGCLRWKIRKAMQEGVVIDDMVFLVFQQRSSPNVSFQRSWADYVNGFGDADDFWIGLAQLHELTRDTPRLLRVEMDSYNGKRYVCEYSNFTVGNSSSQYSMNFGSYIKKRSNTTHDSLTGNKRAKFSTRDRDNDNKSRVDCSRTRHGSSGWWFSSCGYSNPNGVYKTSSVNSAAAVSWYGAGNSYIALRSVRLMLQIK